MSKTQVSEAIPRKKWNMCRFLLIFRVESSDKSFSSVVLCFGYDGWGMDLRFGCGGGIWEVVVIFHSCSGW